MKATLLALASAAVFAVGAPGPATAAKATSLYQFGQSSGYAPLAGVITDKQGTIYGVNASGGSGPCTGGSGCGTVYALSPPSSGGTSWVFKTLYYFQGGQDGSFPTAPLTLAPNGTLYGYTTGGTFGTVFRLLPPATIGGSWTFQILHVFSGDHGNLTSTYAPLIYRHGAIYGIASGGSSTCGQSGCGSVFRLTPGAGGGAWTVKTVFKFNGGAQSGEPNAIVGFDEGPLYVSTSLGNGVVAEISPPASPGPWTEKVIAQFNRDGEGTVPSNLVLASDGSIFGLANGHLAGLAFHLTPSTVATSPWTHATIASISGHRYGPVSLAPGANGTLIGAIEGDFDFFAGAAFQLTPPASGSGAWTYTLLHNFDYGPDRNPLNVVTGRGGNLFGVLFGGDSTGGSLFELPRP